MSELKKLTDRLAGCKNFNVFPGPDWNFITVEERAKAINDALDAIDRGETTLIEKFDLDWEPPSEVEKGNT